MTKKRAALTIAALSALSLAVLTACSGGDGDTSHQPAASASPTRQAGPAERLARMMVTPAELKGRTVKEIGDDFVFAASRADVTVDKAPCTPLAYAMNQLPLGEPRADLARVVSTGKTNGADTYVTLATYTPDGAGQVLRELSTAVAACPTGFTAKSKNSSNTYASIAPERPAAPAGDDTVAFKATMTVQGVTHTLHTEAVRAGDVVAVYFSVNGMAIARGTTSDGKLDAAVVRAQNAKLR